MLVIEQVFPLCKRFIIIVCFVRLLLFIEMDMFAKTALEKLHPGRAFCMPATGVQELRLLQLQQCLRFIAGSELGIKKSIFMLRLRNLPRGSLSRVGFRKKESS